MFQLTRAEAQALRACVRSLLLADKFGIVGKEAPIWQGLPIRVIWWTPSGS
jgi:hypothetical protein